MAKPSSLITMSIMPSAAGRRAKRAAKKRGDGRDEDGWGTEWDPADSCGCHDDTFHEWEKATTLIPLRQAEVDRLNALWGTTGGDAELEKKLAVAEAKLAWMKQLLYACEVDMHNCFGEGLLVRAREWLAAREGVPYEQAQHGEEYYHYHVARLEERESIDVEKATDPTKSWGQQKHKKAGKK